MKLKPSCAYALLSPTSMGVRLTPADGLPVHLSRDYRLQVTSAETNVLSVSAALGLPVKALTALVEDSPIAQLIRSDLTGRGIAVEAVRFPQGGPWGYRHQFNIADSGFGARGPRVHNDRAGEVARALRAGDFDLARIFDQEGVQLLHLSGLIAAIAPELCLELAHRARKSGTAISFDINYRASFWEGQEARLRQVFLLLAGLSDILIGNEEDFQLALGVPGPEAGGVDVTSLDRFQRMGETLRAAFPQVQVVATTLRQVEHAGSHLWGAILLEGGRWHQVEPRPIPVLDRIGGGDGFVGGMLYAILRGWDPAQWVSFGWACGALAVTLPTDYAIPAGEEQVWSIYQGNARIRR